MPSTAALSQRGCNAAGGTNVDLIWEVVNDLYDPQTNPAGFVSLGIAENALMHTELAQFVKDKMNLPLAAFTYGDGPLGTRRVRAAISRFLNRHLHPFKPIEPSHITITNGVTSAIEHCAWSLADPGDGILLGQPYYGSFPADMEVRAGVKTVKVAFGNVDPCGIDCVAAYGAALATAEKSGTRIRGLMLCHPHNPLGRSYSRETLIALMKFCQTHNIHLISDEIYALSVWKNDVDSSPAPVQFESALSINPAAIGVDPALIHCLWGMSKDFGANGLRLGALITQSNEAFSKTLKTTSIYSYVSSLSDHVAANVLEDDAFTDHYIRTNQARLADSYAFTVRFLSDYGITYAPGANAAFFVWADMGSAYRQRRIQNHQIPEVTEKIAAVTIATDNSDTTPRQAAEDAADVTGTIMSKLMAEKVFLANGEAFGSERPGWFRIVFTQPRPYLELGLGRIVKALGLEKK